VMIETTDQGTKNTRHTTTAAKVILLLKIGLAVAAVGERIERDQRRGAPRPR